MSDVGQGRNSASEGPSFSVLTRVIERFRGFDLGDDLEEIERCETMLRQDDLSPTGLRYLGLLRVRVGRYADATPLLEQAAETPELALSSKFLHALALVRAGAHAEGIDRLEAMIAAGNFDQDITLGLVQRGRGDALWAQGKLAEAEKAHRAGLSNEPSAIGYFDLARLLVSQDRIDEALTAIDASVKADDMHHPSHFLAATLLASKGNADKAIKALETALKWDADYATRAREDVRFDPIRKEPTFVELTWPAPPPDLSWLDKYPPLRALSQDPRLSAFTFVDEIEARRAADALVAHYAKNWHLGILWSDKLWAACKAMAPQKLLIAKGPSVHNRNGSDFECELRYDPRSPDRVYFAASNDVPTVLWIPIPAKAESILAALAESCPTTRFRKLDLPRVERAFMGYLHNLAVPNPYTGDLETAGPHELDRHFTMCRLVDPMLWGSAADEEPWPDRIPRQSGFALKLAGFSQTVRAQKEGAVCRFTRRTLFSRSQMSMEIHIGGLYVWELRYRPAETHAVVERFNEITGYNFPTDMPFDLVGALHGFDFIQNAHIEKKLSEQKEEGGIAAHLEVLAALRHQDLSVTEILRRYIDHTSVEVRGAVVNAALQYNWEFLLEDLAALHPTDEIGVFVEKALASGLAPPRFNEMGEPEDLYDGLQDDEGDDEEGDA